MKSETALVVGLLAGGALAFALLKITTPTVAAYPPGSVAYRVPLGLTDAGCPLGYETPQYLGRNRRPGVWV